MRLSTRARYGSRAMLELAASYGNGPVPLSSVAQRQQISERYLENIMTPLVTKGLVVSSRGKNGGFMLSRPPSDIRLGEVVEVVEGSLSPVHCVDDPQGCGKSASCVTHEIWTRLRGAMMGVLDSVSLEDMVRMDREKRGNCGPIYEI